MFCCTKQQSHQGQLITSICLQPQCSNPQTLSQLCCCQCIIKQHKQHNIISLKSYFPILLRINYQKQKMILNMKKMMCQILPDMYQQIQDFQKCFESFLVKIKDQFQQNKQDANKIRKALKSVQQTQIGGGGGGGINSHINNGINQQGNNYTSIKSNIGSSPHKQPNYHSHIKNFDYQSNTISKLMMNTGRKFDTGSNINLQNHHVIQGPWGFSHKMKHSQIKLSTDCKTATKTTNSPVKAAVLSSFPLTYDNDSQVKIKIVQSGGNIMIGFCFQKFVYEKQLMNCYGQSSGTFLLSQNCNDKHSALSFHHSNSKFNRKQIAGWNFFKNDILVLGINFSEQYMYFRNINQNQEFTMPLQNRQFEQPLKLIIILENQNDSVTLYQI